MEDKWSVSEYERIRRRAEQRLKARRDFRSHFTSYVLSNLFMVFIWAVTGAGYFWPIWVIGPWGLGLAFHAINYRNENNNSSTSLDKKLTREIQKELRYEEMLRREMERLRRQETTINEEDDIL